MSMSVEDEVDAVHTRCDNLQRMITDLAEKLGQHKMAHDMTVFHNESVIEIEKRRNA